MWKVSTRVRSWGWQHIVWTKECAEEGEVDQKRVAPIDPRVQFGRRGWHWSASYFQTNRNTNADFLLYSQLSIHSALFYQHRAELWHRSLKILRRLLQSFPSRNVNVFGAKIFQKRAPYLRRSLEKLAERGEGLGEKVQEKCVAHYLNGPSRKSFCPFTEFEKYAWNQLFSAT